MSRRFLIGASKKASLAAIASILCSCQSQGADVLQYEPVSIAGTSPSLVLDAKQQGAPLGSADRIVIRNGHFFTVGTPGAPGSSRRVRFFGVSLALSANFPSETDGEALAQRLAALGVNIIRLHAIDQPAQNSADGPVGMLRDAASPQLDPQAVAVLSRFISQLGRHGIYVDLNLHANHTFPAKQAGDRIPPQSKPLPIIDADMTVWQATYTKNLLSALQLRDRPNLAMVEINNEASLVDTWQEGNLASLVTGGFLDALREKWLTYRKNRQLAATPLPLERSGLATDDARVAARFFIDLDASYIRRMVGTVRDELGDDVPISGTQIIHSGRWNHGGFANFDVNGAASFTDAHFYVDHYLFPHRQWDWTDWRISNGWLGDAPEQTFLNTAFARAAGRPFVISEFNQAWPNQQASDLLPIVTQFAVAQDWDGLILYDYAHDREWNAFTPSDFSLRGDLTKLAQFAQCAAYFRALYPGTALAQSFIALSPDDRATADGNGVTGNLASYLSKHFGIPPGVAMTRQIALENAPNFRVRSAATMETSSYFSYDKAARQFIFGSAYAAGISGFIPVGHRVASSLLELTLAPGSRGFATAFLTSLDGKPLSTSHRLLLSIPGFTMGTDNHETQQLAATDLRGQWRTILPREGDQPSASLYKVAGPAQMERIPATVALQLSTARASVFALDIQGRRVQPVTSKADGRRVTFDINREGQPWAANYEITVER
ncbi:MAG TPA: hypothetical protein VF534_02900 [Paraburkholderia sp.]